MIKFEDLQEGDIVTMKRGAYEIKGPVVGQAYGIPYFRTRDGYITIKPHEFVSAERPKELPTEPGSVIRNVMLENGLHSTTAVLTKDNAWYTSRGQFVTPLAITEWEPSGYYPVWLGLED